jgi:hypothetical protein
MRSNDQLPVVEKAVPIPNIKLRDARNTVRKPSKWRDFLSKLEVGDSFVVEWPECRNGCCPTNRLLMR